LRKNIYFAQKRNKNAQQLFEVLIKFYRLIIENLEDSDWELKGGFILKIALKKLNRPFFQLQIFFGK
jgi:hypothetical protein